MERAIFNRHLPRYYNGYDLNKLWEKDQRGEELTETESTVLMDVMDEAYEELYQQEEKEYVKKVCSMQDKQASFGLMFINPVMIPKGKSIEETLLEIQNKEKERFDNVYEQLKKDGEISK